MMLKFNPDQYAQLGRASYLRRLIALIREHFPGHADGIDDEMLEQGLWEQTLLARRHGLEDERSAATFALTAWLLGKDFDRSMAALTRILESDRLSPTAKAQALEDFTLLLFSILGRQRSAADQEPAP